MKNGKPATTQPQKHTRPQKPTQPPQALLLDMDGVLYHGHRALPGAVAFMQQHYHLPHVFVTNNPIRLPTEIANRLESMGFHRPELTQIITSGEATAAWLASQKPNFRYFAVGAEGLHLALAAQGQADASQADYVVVGEGAGLDFDSLTTGIQLILKHNAQLISTNPDATVDATGNDANGRPVHQILPGGGALVAPFVVATGKQPITVGKPHALLYELAMQRLGFAAEQCLMIGDRPDTDILGAAKLGMQTALVRTGRLAADAPLPEDCPVPDWDCESLASLSQQLRDTFPGWPG